VIRFFKALRRDDLTVDPPTAFFVADAIERIENLAGKRRRFLENRIQHVGRIAVTGELRDLVDAREFA
jgi:hypothetical protein